MTIITDFSVALKTLYNRQVFPWCFWKPVKRVCHKTPADVSGLRPSPLYLTPSFWIQLQLKQQQQKASVFLYWSHSYPGPDQSPQPEQVSLTLLFVRAISTMNYWIKILDYLFSIFFMNCFPKALDFPQYLLWHLYVCLADFEWLFIFGTKLFPWVFLQHS